MSFDTSETTADLSKDSIKFFFPSENSWFSGLLEGLSKGSEKIVVNLDLDCLLTFKLGETDLKF